jgi:transposase
LKGERVHGLTDGKRKGRSNIIAAWSSEKKLFGSQTYEHTIKKVTFLDWLKTSLLRHLREGMVVIMDNAPWHQGEDIKQVIESTGAKLIKLPPYSPDLNPSEHAWANLKAAVKKASLTIPDFRLNISTQIQAIGCSKCD